MTEEEQPQRILSWMGLRKLHTHWSWKLRKAQEKGEDTAELEKRVEAIEEAMEKA